MRRSGFRPKPESRRNWERRTQERARQKARETPRAALSRSAPSKRSERPRVVTCARPGCRRPPAAGSAYCAPGCLDRDRARVGAVSGGFRRRDWDAPALGRCDRPGCRRRAVHRHHVVFEQHVVRHGGDKYDPANQIRLCWQCHTDLHGQRDFPLAALPDRALHFAVALMGAAAAAYLGRYYAGPDTRVELALCASDAVDLPLTGGATGGRTAASTEGAGV